MSTFFEQKSFFNVDKFLGYLIDAFIEYAVLPKLPVRGGMAERSKAADCKSADGRLRRFESYSLHHLKSGFDMRV